MTMNLKKLSGLLLVCAFSACMGTSRYTGRPMVVTHEDDLRERAAFELKCNASTLDVVSIVDTSTAGVTGCGQRTVYKFPSSYTGWLANPSLIEKVPEPPAAQ